MKITTKTRYVKIAKKLDEIHSSGYRGDLMITGRDGRDAVYSITPRGWTGGELLLRHAPLPTIEQVYHQVVRGGGQRDPS